MLTRLGNWSARRRRSVMISWAVLFVVGILLGSRVFGYLQDSNGGSGSESVQGFNLLKDARTSGNSLIALVDGVKVNDPGHPHRRAGREAEGARRAGRHRGGDRV